MTVTAYAVLVICTLNLAIALYVLRQNRHHVQNQAFAFFAVSVATWSFTVTVATQTATPSLFLAQIPFAAASLILLAFLLVLETFPRTDTLRLTFRTKCLLSFGVALSALSFSPYVVSSVTRTVEGVTLTYGPVHGLFVIYAFASVATAAWTLLRDGHASDPQTRLQRKYLAIGFLVPASLSVTTNLLVPFFSGSSRLGLYGPLGSLLMIAMVAHAIIRHRLMDIRVVIKRGAVYLAAFGASGLILLALLVGSNLLFHDNPQVPLREILIALVVAVLFHPLKGRIQQVFDRYLYREPYDYQRTVRQASRTLTGTIDLPTLLGHVSAVVSQTLRPEGLAIYLLDEEEGLFERAFAAGSASTPVSLPSSSPLLEAVSRDRKLVFRDEIGQDKAAPGGDAVLDDLARLGAEVIVPLLEEDRLIGFVSVGAKRAGDPYFSDDADLLTTLANQSAVAIRNAQAHQQVVQFNEDIQKILATIDSGVIAIGAKGRVTLFNRAAELLTATPPGTLRGQPADHLPAALAHLIDATVRDGQSRPQMELALPDPAGQLIPIMCSTSPLVDPQGAPIGAVAVFSDLSRLKDLEQDRRRAERLASLEAIASGMVHEIRNPLVSLKAFAQLLPTRGQEHEFRDRFARVAEREITRIDDLLGRFRTLSSAPSQPMEPVDIPTPLRATLELLEPEMQARHIRLRQVADGNPRPVLGNAPQLQQLFHNLCLNAIEAMKPGGELTVRVADLIECGGMTLHVEVSDTGPGIPEDLLPRIFNPFVTTKSRGSGLGLAICSSIADAHRATLRARNNTHRSGATFTVEFPVIAERAARVTT